jgi:RimJ/RimL family protein N-acetyltransferase
MFKGKKVELRSAEKSDAAAYYKIWNDCRTREFLSPAGMFPQSMAEAEKLLENIASPQRKDIACTFAITFKGKFIGLCGYDNRNTRAGTCSVSIMIAPAVWGKGLGTDAFFVLLKFLFGELNVRKVQLSVFAEHKRAVACYKKLGFREEGLFKEQFYRDGGYHDELHMALFARDASDI